MLSTLRAHSCPESKFLTIITIATTLMSKFLIIITIATTLLASFS